MAIEIERKFLVRASFKEFAQRQTRMIQTYLSINPQCNIRIRICEEKAYLTIKGKSNDSGLSRYEWEHELPIQEARDLIKLSEFEPIIKTRYFIPMGKHCYEVDEFEGKNHGLILAELELNNENEVFEKPDWLGREVSGEAKYYNSMLQLKPYSTWETSEE